jgi:hypothetical protein
MLLWPTVAVLGFLAMTGLVVALGARSTARYEFERNRVQPQGAQPATREASRASGRHPAGSRRAGDPRAGAAEAGGATRPAADGAPVAVRLAPAGGTGPPPAEPPVSGWWVVGEPADDPGTGGAAGTLLAGPFADRIDADWAALAVEPAGAVAVHVVHGVRRDGGALVLRPSPEELAWLAELGGQLDRLGGDWDDLVSDTDDLTTLVVDVTAALVEAGLPLRDCADDGPGTGPVAGGVCLTPDPAARGVLVSWRSHDRMSRDHVRGVEGDAAVQRTMGAAVADVLAGLGFRVEEVTATGSSLVSRGG